MSGLPGRLVDSYTAAQGIPGAFWFDGTDRLYFVCPCGCDTVAGIEYGAGKWTWDGNREQPTIAPSIQIMTGCKWHGFLRAGQWESV